MARTEVGIQKRMRQDSNIIRINFKTSKVRRMNEGEKKRFKILNKYEKKNPRVKVKIFKISGVKKILISSLHYVTTVDFWFPTLLFFLFSPQNTFILFLFFFLKVRI